jgi:hypothetical protein
MAFCDNISPNGETFGAAISTFSCSNQSQGQFPSVALGYNAWTFNQDPDIPYVCFRLQVGIDEIYPGCDTFFVVGFNTTNLVTNANIKVTYTLNLLRNCTS